MFEEIDSILNSGKKVLFAGIGNVLRSDDGAGVYITRKIKNKGRISSLTVETGIENYIGKINNLNPDVLILVDCADMGAEPGRIILTDVRNTIDVTFNTHNISLGKLNEFFRMPVFLLSIQPENIEFGENISYIVKKCADQFIDYLNHKEVHHGSRISL